MRKFKAGAKQIFIIIVAALAVVLSSCADPALVNPDEDAPAAGGSVPAMEATPTSGPATPTPTPDDSAFITPVITPKPTDTPMPEEYPISDIQWKSEKSIYEITPGNMYGLGTVAVKRNGKIYYRSTD